MGDKRLHTITIPRDALVNTKQKTNRNLSSFGNLGAGPASVESVSVNPQDRILAGQFRAQRSKMLADMIEELFDAPNYDFAMFFDKDEKSKEDGFYALSNTDVSPIEPKVDGVHEFDGRLKKKGTRESHFLAIQTNMTQVDHPFGSDSIARVAAPDTATNVRWFNEDQTTETATAVSQRDGEFGAIDFYDRNEASGTRPALIYQMDYADMGKMDMKVWDDRGFEDNRTDANGNLQWQKVFSPSHEFEGDKWVSNGVRRFQADEPAGNLTGDVWDGAQWSSANLGGSIYNLFEFDITYINQARVDAQVTFENSNDGSLYAVNFSLQRGYKRPYIWKPDGESDSIPTELQNALDNVAQASFNDPQSKMVLIKREEIRK